MNVLIGNPAYRRKIGGGLERYMLGSGMRFPWSLLKREDERPRYAMFPFFLAYTAGLLERDGFDVSVVDAVPLNLQETEFESRVADVSPDVIILEPNSAVIDDAIRQVGTLHEQTNALIILVGSHVTARAREVFSQCPELHYAVMGEYELGLLKLLQHLRDGTAVEGLPGVAYRDAQGYVHAEGIAPSIEQLDELPPPARHLFPAYFDNNMALYHDGFCQNSPAFHMHASRGCPYRCNFCVWVQVLYENGKQRLFSPARIVDEMTMLVDRFGAREIYFDDDNFSANRMHVYALCDELIRRKVNIPWSAMADAIALNEGMLEKMAEAGCIGVKFGLDSADSNVLDLVKKPLKVSRVDSLVAKARRLGIKTHMTVVLGLSGETRATLDRTFNFACDLDIDSIQFSLATPCPGTTLYKELDEQNKLNKRSWDQLDGANSSVVVYDDFSREYIEQYMASAHSRWLWARMKHPLWLLRQFRYLWRLAQGQGLGGLYRRVRRASQLLAGDAAIVGSGAQKRSMRW